MTIFSAFVAVCSSLPMSCNAQSIKSLWPPFTTWPSWVYSRAATTAFCAFCSAIGKPSQCPAAAATAAHAARRTCAWHGTSPSPRPAAGPAAQPCIPTPWATPLTRCCTRARFGCRSRFCACHAASPRRSSGSQSLDRIATTERHYSAAGSACPGSSSSCPAGTPASHRQKVQDAGSSGARPAV